MKIFDKLKNLIEKVSFLNKGEDNSSSVKNLIKNSTINAPVQQAQTIFNTTETPDRADIVPMNFISHIQEILKDTSETMKITYNTGDQDARRLAEKFAEIFKNLGWVIEGPIVNLSGSIHDGVHIRTNHVNKTRQDFANLIGTTGFKVAAYNNGKEDKIEIFIGRK